MRSRYQPREIHDPESIEGIDEEYLSDILCNYYKQDDIDVVSFTKEQLKPGLVSRVSGGIMRYRLRCRRKDVGEYGMSVILKICPSPGKLSDVWESYVTKLGYPRLAEMVQSYMEKLHPFRYAIVEITSYRTFIPKLPIGAPEVYHTVLDEDTERFWIFMEDVSGNFLVDSSDDISLWTEEIMESAIVDMAKMHSLYWNEEKSLARYDWLFREAAEWIESTLSLWEENLRVGLVRCSRFLDRRDTRILEGIVENLVGIYTRLERGTHTLVHGDFSPRHLCFRREGSRLKTVLYDWGAVSVNVPQFDLHFFVNFIVDPDKNLDLVDRLIGFYLDSLRDSIREALNKDDFMDIYNLSLLRYLGTRELAACSLTDEGKDPWAFWTLRHNLRWAERIADRYL